MNHQESLYALDKVTDAMTGSATVIEKLWWDLWIATWEILAWMEAWSESEAKLQCLRLHGPACDLKGHWFAPWTSR